MIKQVKKMKSTYIKRSAESYLDTRGLAVSLRRNHSDKHLQQHPSIIVMRFAWGEKIGFHCNIQAAIFDYLVYYFITFRDIVAANLKDVHQTIVSFISGIIE